MFSSEPPTPPPPHVTSPWADALETADFVLSFGVAGACALIASGHADAALQGLAANWAPAIAADPAELCRLYLHGFHVVDAVAAADSEQRRVVVATTKQMLATYAGKPERHVVGCYLMLRTWFLCTSYPQVNAGVRPLVADATIAASATRVINAGAAIRHWTQRPTWSRLRQVGYSYTKLLALACKVGVVCFAARRAIAYLSQVPRVLLESEVRARSASATDQLAVSLLRSSDGSLRLSSAFVWLWQAPRAFPEVTAALTTTVALVGWRAAAYVASAF